MFRRVTTIIAIIFLVTLGLACTFLRPKTPLTWHILLEVDAAVPERTTAALQAVTVIERRLDAIGVYSSEVVAQGTPPNGRILVNLPEVPDRERVIRLITSQGLLEILAIVSQPNPAPVETYASEQDALTSLGGPLPQNLKVMPYIERAESIERKQDSSPGERPNRWVVTQAHAIINGSEIRDAEAISSVTSELGEPIYNISFSLKPEGAQKFGAWTGDNINNYIGVVLNGRVRSIAFIRTQIFDQAEITGNFTQQAAKDLALILRSGALPASVSIIEEGPNK